MAFHKSKYGKHGDSLPSDLEGNVPEEGDHWEDLIFPADMEWTEESWDEFVSMAVAETEEAGRSIARWRKEGEN